MQFPRDVKRPRYFLVWNTTKLYIVVKQPYGSCLVHWERCVQLNRRIRKWTWSGSLGVRVVQDSNSTNFNGRRWISKPWTCNNVVVITTRLIHSNQKWERLTNMNVHIRIILLNCIWPFSLNKKQIMILYSKIQTGCNSTVMNTKTICSS